MTTLEFTFPLEFDGVTVAEIEASVRVLEDGDGFGFEDLCFTDWSGKLKVPVPDNMREAVETWLTANKRDDIYDAMQDERDSGWAQADRADYEYDRKRDERNTQP